MSWLIVILKSIPALRKLGELLERNIRQANAKARRNTKDDLVDEAIADAISHGKRVRDGEVRERPRSDKDSP